MNVLYYQFSPVSDGGAPGCRPPPSARVQHGNRVSQLWMIFVYFLDITEIWHRDWLPEADFLLWKFHNLSAADNFLLIELTTVNCCSWNLVLAISHKTQQSLSNLQISYWNEAKKWNIDSNWTAFAGFQEQNEAFCMIFGGFLGSCANWF